MAAPRPAPDPKAVAAGRLGAARKHDPDGDHSDLEREVRFLFFLEHAREVVEEAPPFTAKQRAELARVMRGS